MSSDLMNEAFAQILLGVAAGCCIAFAFARLVRYLAAAHTARKLARQNQAYAMMLQRADGWPWRETPGSMLPTLAATTVCLFVVVALATMLHQAPEAIRQANASITDSEGLRPTIENPAAQRTMWIGNTKRLLATAPLAHEPSTLPSFPAFHTPPRVHPDAPLLQPEPPLFAAPMQAEPGSVEGEPQTASLAPDSPPGADEDELVVSRHDLFCLAKAVYFEAAGEPVEGQLAVAEVVINRVKDRHFPDTICGVVFQNRHVADKCQFSFACDGQVDEPSHIQAWEQALELAQAVIRGDAAPSGVGRATHFHATSVRPDWVDDDMTETRRVGDHIFYTVRRWS